MDSRIASFGSDANSEKIKKLTIKQKETAKKMIHQCDNFFIAVKNPDDSFSSKIFGTDPIKIPRLLHYAQEVVEGSIKNMISHFGKLKDGEK